MLHKACQKWQLWALISSDYYTLVSAAVRCISRPKRETWKLTLPIVSSIMPIDAVLFFVGYTSDSQPLKLNVEVLPLNEFMWFIWISKQTTIIWTYVNNWVTFVTETERVYCAVRLNIKIYFSVIFIFKGLIRVVEQTGDGATKFWRSSELYNVDSVWWNLGLGFSFDEIKARKMCEIYKLRNWCLRNFTLKTWRYRIGRKTASSWSVTGQREAHGLISLKKM